MANSVSRVLFVLFCSAVAATAVADETLRCGGKIIMVGMTQSEVLKYCGEPTSKTAEEQNVRGGKQVTGTTQVLRWTYDAYNAKHVLVFDQDKLIAIE